MDETTLRTILLGQKDEKNRILKDENLIERECLDRTRPLLRSDSIKVIFGVRRAGKSTLAHQLLSDHEYAYINFDDERLVGITKEELDHVFQISCGLIDRPTHALLDEIQNVPGWELFINRLQREGMNVIITGSSANLLSTELSTHLTGRYLPIFMLPFSFRESLIARGSGIPARGEITTRKAEHLKTKAEKFLRSGGFPQVILDPANARLYLSTLYNDIINKDVIGRFHPKYVRTLRELALFLTSSSSNLMTYSSLKKRFDLSSTHTVMNYVHYLTEASLMMIVDKFTFRQTERSASPKKIYSIDTGIVELLSISPGDHIANLLENAVFLELKRRNDLDPTFSINYWRDYQDHEVDLVISRKRKVETLIQVSMISDIADMNKRETRSLVKASKELRCEDLLLITWDLEGEVDEKGQKIKMMPFWKWALYV